MALIGLIPLLIVYVNKFSNNGHKFKFRCYILIMKDLIKELLIALISAPIVVVIIIVIAIMCSGCASVTGRPLSYYQDMSPDNLEAWIKYELPYVKGFFDCSEYAEFAIKRLRMQGCKAEVRINRPQKQSYGKNERHASVAYDCPKYGKGEILDYW